MDASFMMDCYRQKLLKNLHFTLLATESEIQLIKKQSDEVNLVIRLNLQCRIDWKVKSGHILAIGIISDKLHWYYGEHVKLMELKRLIGGRVLFRGISEQYKPLQQIGQGTFSNVYLLQSQLDQQYYASKCIDKTQVEHLSGDEIEVMKILQHQSITQLIEVFEGDVSYYLIMEHLDIEAVDYIKDHDVVINDVQMIMQQLLEAVAYIHSMGYMHRDLKPENIMFRGSIYLLKIIDFGLAIKSLSFARCGTPGYVAPEILNIDQNFVPYNEKCDMFSVGVVFYKFLTKKDLFTGQNHDEVLKANKRCDIDLELRSCQMISKSAHHLLTQLLAINPDQRITASKALQHRFFDEINMQQQQPQQIQLVQQESIKRQVSRKASIISKCLSPFQKQRLSHSIHSFQLDMEEVNSESPMQPLPQLITKGGSYIRVHYQTDKKKEMKKSQSQHFKHPEPIKLFRPLKPRQLLELYN